MRIFSSLLVLVLFASLLEASSYYRSIRVSAFPTKVKAQQSVVRVKKFLASKKVVQKYKKEIGFDVKVAKVGKYYMSVIEPFFDEKKKLQEVLDIVRARYPKAYVRKLKSNKYKQHKKSVTQKVHKKVAPKKEKKQKIVEVVKPVVEVVAKEKQIVAQNKPKEVTPTTEPKVVQKKESSKSKEVQKMAAPAAVAVVEEVVTQEVVEKVAPKKEQEDIQKIQKEFESLDMTQPEDDQEELQEELNIWLILFVLTFMLLVLVIVYFLFIRKNGVEIIVDEEAQKEAQELSVTVAKLNKEIATLQEQQKEQESAKEELELLFGEFIASLTPKDNALDSEKVKEIVKHFAYFYATLESFQPQLIRDARPKENLTFDLKTMVELFVTLIEQKAQEKNITIESNIEQSIPSLLKADPFAIAELFSHTINKVLAVAQNEVLRIDLEKISEKKDGVEVAFVFASPTLRDVDIEVSQNLLQMAGASYYKDGNAISLVTDCQTLQTQAEVVKEQEVIEVPVVEKQEEQEVQKQEEVKALEVEAGIENCGDDSEIYISMVEDFLDSYKDSDKELEKLCDAQDFAKARELAVEIKDFAQHIGAYQLSQNLSSLEESLAQESQEIACEFFGTYKENLEKVLQEIEQYKQK